MAVPPDAVQAQLQRILSSKSFATSARLTRFLRFTVTAALEGRAAELKEYVIGVGVFDRKASFDPRVEPIVRVEARRLRAKLRQYYETDGQLDALIIDFPKGSYTPKFRSRDAVDPAASQPAAPSHNTVAVLPFANLGSDADNEYFSDGLTEELIHALTKVEGLLVVARPSAFHFKGQAQDVQKIGEQLGVHSVLEGSVRRSGSRLRISAQLIEVATGFYLWSETYERKIEDVFAIQEEIAHAIVDALKVKLTGSGERRL
ncbi:MAG: hypothetical protein ACRD8O_00275, partial [Bryobacteraceae bacterium]